MSQRKNHKRNIKYLKQQQQRYYISKPVGYN